MAENTSNPNAKWGGPHIGVLFATFLYGIACVQCGVWFKAHRSAPILSKLLIVLLMVADTLHIIFAAAMTYHYLITSPTDHGIVWSYKARVVVELFLSNFTQILYALRLWKLMKRRWALFPVLTGFIGLSLFMNIWLPLQIDHSAQANVISGLAPHPRSNPTSDLWATALTLSLASLIDFTLGLALAYCLWTSKLRLNWTDSNAKVIIAYIFNTGILVGFFSLPSLIAYLVLPGTVTFIAIRFVDSQLYTNSFLAMVNSKFYFQSAKIPVPPRNFARVVEMPMDPGYGLGRASSNFTDDSCRPLQPQTINEIGLAGFPLYHDRDLEKTNGACIFDY